MKRRLFGAALLAGLAGLVANEAQARGRRSGGSRSHTTGGGGRGGCGSRGGPGYRKANGKCAGHKD